MEELTKLQIGEHFTYKNMEWICLDHINGNILAMTAKVWQELPFDVNNHNDWNNSSLRRVLNNEFLEKLDRKHLVPFKPDLMADNGDLLYAEKAESDYVFILSCDQYRKYRKHIPLFDEWMWTCTPWNCSPYSGIGYSVRYVNTTGNIGNSIANSSYGVAPACIFSSENLKLCRQAHLEEIDEPEEG